MVSAIWDRSCLVGALICNSPHRPRIAVPADDGYGNERCGPSVRDAFCSRLGGFFGSNIRWTGASAAPRSGSRASRPGMGCLRNGWHSGLVDGGWRHSWFRGSGPRGRRGGGSGVLAATVDRRAHPHLAAGWRLPSLPSSTRSETSTGQGLVVFCWGITTPFGPHCSPASFFVPGLGDISSGNRPRRRSEPTV